MKEHPDFEVKSWRMQRVGRFLMVVIVLAAFAGVFGDGPLSEREVAECAVRVQYPQFL